MLSLSALIDWLSERRDQPSHEQDVRCAYCPDSVVLVVIVFTDMERELETERRKSASLQDSLKENEKEYHKLKVRRP